MGNSLKQIDFSLIKVKFKSLHLINISLLSLILVINDSIATADSLRFKRTLSCGFSKTPKKCWVDEYVQKLEAGNNSPGPKYYPSSHFLSKNIFKK